MQCNEMKNIPKLSLILLTQVHPNYISLCAFLVDKSNLNLASAPLVAYSCYLDLYYDIEL